MPWVPAYFWLIDFGGKANVQECATLRVMSLELIEDDVIYMSWQVC